MNRNEIKANLQEFPVAILPMGSTEQHGPHLPLGVDIFLAEGIAKRVCMQIGAVLLPTVPFGYSWVWRDIPGTVSIQQKNLEAVIKDIAHSLDRYNVKILIIINGHDANGSSIKYAARELVDEIGMQVIYFSYPNLHEVLTQYCDSPAWHGMIHACEFETSLMLALKPELVHMEKAVREYPAMPDLYGKSAVSLGSLSESGVFGDPTLATAEKGQEILDYYVRNITKTILTAYDQIK